MTEIVPRRQFDEDCIEVEVSQPPSKETHSIDLSTVRATGSIPVEYNERLKAMARRQGKTADQLIGEILLEMRPMIDQWEAKQEAARLREKFGPNWMQLLEQVA